MRRSSVNKQSTNIFNCIFESSKAAKNEELFVENGLREIYDFELTMAALSMIAP